MKKNKKNYRKTRERIRDIKRECINEECLRLKCINCAISSRFENIVGIRLEEMAKFNLKK